MTRTVSTLLALGLAAYGLKRLWSAGRKRQADDTPQRVSDWESEGGAVPVGRSRVAAAVAPVAPAR